MTPVTDPALLQQLEGGGPKPVTDPVLLKQLDEAPAEAPATPQGSGPTQFKGAFLSDDPRDWELPQNKLPERPNKEHGLSVLNMVHDIAMAVAGAKTGKPTPSDVLTLGSLTPAPPAGGILARPMTGTVGARIKNEADLAAAKVARPPTPSPRDVTLQNAKDVGVTLPRAAVGGMTPKATGAILSQVPFVGAPMQKAGELAQKQIEGALEKTIEGYGGASREAAGGGIKDALQGQVATEARAADAAAEGVANNLGSGSPVVAGEGVRNTLAAGTKSEIEGLGASARDIASSLGSNDRLRAGEGARQSIADWIREGSKQEAASLYAPVEKNIAEGERIFGRHATQELTNTRSVAGDLVESANKSMVKPPEILKYLRTAINSPEGLTFGGLQNLRTEIGDRLSGSITPEPGMSGRALKAIYSGLTRDLEALVKTVKPPTVSEADALAAWRAANDKFDSTIASKRASLSAIVGDKGDFRPEGVLDRLHAMASAGKGADLTRLAQAKSVIAPTAWNDIASTLVGHMGQTKDGFDPAAFRSAFSGISDEGRALLFGPKGSKARDGLEALHEASASPSLSVRHDMASPGATLDRVHAMARTNGGADINRLLQIKSAVGPQAWKEVASAIIKRMGDSPQGFSAKNVATQFARLSENGKSALFGPAGSPIRDEMERVVSRAVPAVSAKEAQIAKLIGAKGDASAEAVVDRLVTMASAKRGADIQRLQEIKKLVGKSEWDDFASAALQQMGRTKDGLSIARLRTAYEGLSAEGKTILFGTDARRASLDKLMDVAKHYEYLQRAGNPSGSAKAVYTIGALAGAIAHPFVFIGTVLGDRGLASFLASPAKLRVAADATEAAIRQLQKPSAANRRQYEVLVQQFNRIVGTTQSDDGGDKQ